MFDNWIVREYREVEEFLEAIINHPAEDLICVMQDQSGWLMISSDQHTTAWSWKRNEHNRAFDEILYPMFGQKPDCLKFIYAIRQFKAPESTLKQSVAKFLESKNA